MQKVTKGITNRDNQSDLNKTYNTVNTYVTNKKKFTASKCIRSKYVRKTFMFVAFFNSCIIFLHSCIH